MRLIDADALKEWVDDSISQYGNQYSTDMLNMFGLFKEVIDNAPTVEPEIKEVPIANVTFDTEKLKELTDGIVERIKNGELVLQDERPKGEWITSTNDNGISYQFFCDKCKREVQVITNFCPNCGADMRGEDNG